MCSSNVHLVEVWRVELQSKDQKPAASPSAVYVFTFPLPDSHRQDSGFSSFIKSHHPQSLRWLVPCICDADDLRRRRLRVDVHGLSRESYVVVVVSSFFVPLLRRFRAAARFHVLPYPCRNQYTPIFDCATRSSSVLFPNRSVDIPLDIAFGHVVPLVVKLFALAQSQLYFYPTIFQIYA